MTITKRWWRSVPFAFALVVLFFLFWCLWKVIFYPNDGIQDIRQINQILYIDPHGPSAGLLLPGDKILTIDGTPVREAIPFYAEKFGGDRVTFEVDRNGDQLTIGFTLSNPTLSEFIERFLPLLIAFIFWFVGVGIETFKQPDSIGRIAFIFFQASAVLIASGAVSYSAPPLIVMFFGVLLWWIGPLSLHFHMDFPQVNNFRWQPLALALFYTVAAAGSILTIIYRWPVPEETAWSTYVVVAAEVYIIMNLIGVAILLAYDYKNATAPGIRGKIRIVVLGGLLALLPIMTMVLLPGALMIKTIVPYALPFFLLGILPLTYGYAIFRYRLIEIEKHVNRGAAFLLVYTLLLMFYVLIYGAIDRWLTGLENEPLVSLVIVLVLASIFSPLRLWVQRLVDKVFYGGWYDYRSAVTQITGGLDQITNQHLLARTLGERLAGTLRLESAVVFFRDNLGDFSIVEMAPLNRHTTRPRSGLYALPRSSLDYLLKLGEHVGRMSMREALAEARLTPEEQSLLKSEQEHLWVPVIGHNQIQGYLALGPKLGGDIFGAEDLDILRTVAWQVAPVVDNIHLVNRLKDYAAELEERVRQRTAELHDAKERVEAILASVGDGVIVTGLDGAILTVNTAFEKQCHFPGEELIGESFFDILARHNEQAMLEALLLRLNRGETWHGELNFPRRHEVDYSINLTMAPVFNQAGQRIGYVGSQRDITRQRELERLKDQFVADVSHELRTPASNLSLYVELLEKAGDTKRKEYVDVLKGQCRLLVKLVDDILDLSRLDMGRVKKVKFYPVDLNWLVRQEIKANLPLAEAGGLALNFHPMPDLPRVHGEPNQLARVITNLLTNAIRYTPQGEVLVSTCVEDSQVVLQVSDTGMGIDLADQEHIFERFYRGQQVRQSLIHGTGLGLAIIKEIVDLHEGRITFESELGSGTTFKVYLPSSNQPVSGE